MTSSVRACPALAGVAVGRLVMGPIDVLRALQRSLLLLALRVVGGGSVALPQIRLRMSELTLLLPVSRHALGGAHTGSSSWDFDRSPRPARDELSQSGARRRPPRPSGVADVDSSSTFAGFRLA